MKATESPPPGDHCYVGPTAPLGNSLELTGTFYVDHDPVIARAARITVWTHARGDSPEAEQDDGLELLDALGLLGEPA